MLLDRLLQVVMQGLRNDVLGCRELRRRPVSVRAGPRRCLEDQFLQAHGVHRLTLTRSKNE
jgi:hypothetical protein